MHAWFSTFTAASSGFLAWLFALVFCGVGLFRCCFTELLSNAGTRGTRLCWGPGIYPIINKVQCGVGEWEEDEGRTKAPHSLQAWHGTDCCCQTKCDILGRVEILFSYRSADEHKVPSMASLACNRGITFWKSSAPSFVLAWTFSLVGRRQQPEAWICGFSRG